MYSLWGKGVVVYKTSSLEKMGGRIKLCHEKNNKVRQSPVVHSAVTQEILYPVEKFPWIPGIIKYPIFVSRRYSTEIAGGWGFRQLSLDI
jgi:hypothetical protein